MNTLDKSQAPKPIPAFKLTADEAKTVRGVIEAVGELKSPIGSLEQKRQKQFALRAELNSDLLKLQAVADPYDERNIQSAVVAELVTTRRLELLDKLKSETDTELGAARH